jgi:hypothetical protein
MWDLLYASLLALVVTALETAFGIDPVAVLID